MEELETLDPNTGQVNAIIESPKGSRNKFNYEPQRGLFRLGKVLPAGAVGQGVYGAGAAFAFVTRAFHRLPRVPFLLYCDYPFAVMRHADGCGGLRLHGVPLAACRLRLIAENGPVPGGTEVEVWWTG